MKWWKWLLTMLISLVIIGVIIIIVDRELFWSNQNEFPLSMYNLRDSEHYKVQTLDKTQIKLMVEQLIPGKLEDKGTVILSSADEKIMGNFEEPLAQKLPKGWRLTMSSDPNAIVTGDLFNLIPKDQPIGIRIKDGKVVQPSPKSDVNQRCALFLFWVADDNDLKAKKILSATSNYKTPNITAASKNLLDDARREGVKGLKVALINTGKWTKSRLVTASILEEMVNAKTELTFLDQRDPGKHYTELKDALQSRKGLDLTAKNFSESTGASAVLIIQPRDTHFQLKLVGMLPRLDILAIGTSDDRPFEITIDAQPLAEVSIETPKEVTTLGYTPQVLSQRDIEKYKVTTGTKFTLKRDDETRIYIHTDRASMKEPWAFFNGNETISTYRRKPYDKTELRVEDKGDKIKYLYTWW